MSEQPENTAAENSPPKPAPREVLQKAFALCSTINYLGAAHHHGVLTDEEAAIKLLKALADIVDPVALTLKHHASPEVQEVVHKRPGMTHVEVPEKSSLSGRGNTIKEPTRYVLPNQELVFKILDMCAQGHSNTEVANATGCSTQMVYKLRVRSDQAQHYWQAIDMWHGAHPGVNINPPMRIARKPK